MTRRLLLGIALSTLFLTACGSTNTVRQPLPESASGNFTYKIVKITSSAPEVPEKFKENLRKYLNESLDKQGLLTDGNSTRDVSIDITEFSMSQGATRLLGALAGKDQAISAVNVVDTASNELIGSSTIESTDRLAGGGPELFTSNHAKAISNFLQGGR